MIGTLLRSPMAAVLAAMVVIAATLAPSGTSAEGLPAQAALSDEERAAIENVVRNYILENPEIIMEAVQILQQRQETAEAERRAKGLVAYNDELFKDPQAPVAGNPQGDVVLVEFFDYQCGYCKQVHPSLTRLIDEDDQLRFVFKEFPILGPASVAAAKAALASRAQGKYIEFHNALMGNRGPLDEPKIMRIARSVGLDTDRLKTDMEAPEVTDIIDANLRLAEALEIRGTPAFVIGDQIVPGAVGLDVLKRLVEEERAG